MIHVRTATAADAADITRLNVALAMETEGKQLPSDVVSAGVRSALADPSKARYFIADLDGTLAGQCMVTQEWSDWRNGYFWWVQSVYVLPTCRRRGVYRRLYDEVRHQARATREVCGVRLYVERQNRVAQATYLALGMIDAGYLLLEEDWAAGSD